ncbi:MAG: hypothetical protein QXV69_02495 [Sulfolobaceae archaeon]
MWKIIVLLLLTSTYFTTLNIPLLGEVNIYISETYSEKPINFTIKITPSSLVIESEVNFSKFNFSSNISDINLFYNKIIIPIYLLNSTIKIILQNKSYNIQIIILPPLNKSSTGNILSSVNNNNTGINNNTSPIWAIDPLKLMIIISIISIVSSILIKILRRTE